MSDEPLTERPLTFCPACGGELDLTYADPGDQITCVVCGSELNVISLEPPDVEETESA